MLYEKYLNAINEKREKILGVADAIWDTPELAFGEYRSSETLQKALEEEGFTITRGIAEIPTAFRAEFGSGRPAIGILAEFDALPNLNYQAGVAEPIFRTDAQNGHGCGHNLFAGGSLAAAIALKKFVQEQGRGSITLFGCPGEENGGGKVYMARARTFNDMDAIVSWHPEKMHMVRTRPSLANVEVDYTFKGIASHAGGSPERGRSALDAVELMSVGCNYLREHIPTTCRIHYAYLNAGGEAPNIVQANACVRYLIRANDNEEVRTIWERVNKVAKGAAMMTETEVSWKVMAAYSNLVTNSVMQRTGYEAMQDIPVPVPTEEDIAFGKALQATIALSKEDAAKPLYADRVLEPAPPKAHGGSTDTADVSWNCPTLQFHIATWVTGTPGHSWQAAAQGKSHFAHEALLYAGKVLASTAMRLMEDPERLEKARAEFAEKTAGGYVCPLPEDLMPKIRPRD
ncbi:MAG: amidohydrolase [Clostridia bacterium]|nr:amidohydrolase [Clostridia bacterium]